MSLSPILIEFIKKALVSYSACPDQWHTRSSHPSPQVVQFLLRIHNLSCLQRVYYYLSLSCMSICKESSITLPTPPNLPVCNEPKPPADEDKHGGRRLWCTGPTCRWHRYVCVVGLWGWRSGSTCGCFSHDRAGLGWCELATWEVSGLVGFQPRWLLSSFNFCFRIHF